MQRLRLLPAVEDAGRRGPAWMVSLAVHAAALGVLLHLLRPAPIVTPPEPPPLVFVEPAPAPPLPLGVPTGDVATPPVAELPTDVVREPPKRVEAKPKPLRTPPPRPAAPQPALPRGETLGGPDGTAGGVVGGTPGGVVGGRPGGQGDAPIPADRVAHPPVPIQKVLPTYPPMARARGLEGVVVLRAIVDREGRVEEAVTVVTSAPTFDEAAVAAVRRWRFQPGRDGDNTIVRVLIEIPIRFQLR